MNPNNLYLSLIGFALLGLGSGWLLTILLPYVQNRHGHILIQKLQYKKTVLWIMPVLFTLASAQERPVTQLLWLLPWMTVLVALALLDLQSRVLPNTFTLTLTVTGIAASLIGLTVTIHQALLGLALGYLSFYILQLLYRRLTGRTGVGFGDLKLAAALGVWLGWQPLTLVIMLASLSASFVGLLLILFKCKHRNHYIPFGPFLVLSALIVMLGQPLLILN